MPPVLKRLLVQAGPFLGLAVVIALFAVPAETREFFLTYHNFKIILTQTVIVAIGALGMTLIIISGGIDLSVGSTIAFTGVIGALLIQQGCSIPVVVVTAIAAGGAIGLLHGLAIAKLRMTPFIVTLGSLGIVRGAAILCASSQTVTYDDSPLNGWMRTKNAFDYTLPVGVWVAIALALLTAVLLRKTVFGRYIFALGSNESAARLCGVPTGLVKITTYTLGGCLFGLAGIFQLSRLGVGDPTVANGLELDIIAAVIIGGASLNGGVGTILGSMIGAFTMAVLRNGSGQMGWPTPVQMIIIGCVIIIAVFIDRLRQGRSST